MAVPLKTHNICNFFGACGPKKAEMLKDRKKEKTYAESSAIKIAAV